jgi:hypothetical protein
MITVMLDNDVAGHRDLFAGTLVSTGWAEYDLVRFITIQEAGLAGDAVDRDVWRHCQANQLLLLTANRNQDNPDSLEQTLREETNESSLPICTISDPRRIVETDYRERCIHSLINIVLDLDNLLGSGRQYVP